MKKFELTLSHLQKVRNNEISANDSTLSDMLISLEKKY